MSQPKPSGASRTRQLAKFRTARLACLAANGTLITLTAVLRGSRRNLSTNRRSRDAAASELRSRDLAGFSPSRGCNGLSATAASRAKVD